MFLYANNERTEREIKKIPFTIVSERNKFNQGYILKNTRH